MIRYRAATLEDAEPLSEAASAIFTETFAPLYRPEDLAAFLRDCLSPAAYAGELASGDYTVMLALEDERIVGFAKLGPPTLRPDSGGGELWQLYVLRGWQGTGVGAALMDWALDRLRADGHDHLHLSVYVDNHRARRFYARYGAVDVGRHDFPVGAQIDEDRVLRIAL